jgi:hypothetical protein
MLSFLLRAKAAEDNAKWQVESQIHMRGLAHRISVPISSHQERAEANKAIRVLGSRNTPMLRRLRNVKMTMTTVDIQSTIRHPLSPVRLMHHSADSHTDEDACPRHGCKVWSHGSPCVWEVVAGTCNRPWCYSLRNSDEHLVCKRNMHYIRECPTPVSTKTIHREVRHSLTVCREATTTSCALTTKNLERDDSELPWTDVMHIQAYFQNLSHELMAKCEWPCERSPASDDFSIEIAGSDCNWTDKGFAYLFQMRFWNIPPLKPPRFDECEVLHNNSSFINFHYLTRKSER